MNLKGIFLLAVCVLAKKSKKLEKESVVSYQKSKNLEPSDQSWLAYLVDEEPNDDLIPINTFAANESCNPNDLKFKGCHAALISPDLAVTNRYT